MSPSAHSALQAFTEHLCFGQGPNLPNLLRHVQKSWKEVSGSFSAFHPQHLGIMRKTLKNSTLSIFLFRRKEKGLVVNWKFWWASKGNWNKGAILLTYRLQNLPSRDASRHGGGPQSFLWQWDRPRVGRPCKTFVIYGTDWLKRGMNSLSWLHLNHAPS